MLDKSLLRQAVMANGKQNRQTENNDKSILRRSLEKQAGVAPGSFAPTNTVVPTTPQRIYKPGAKTYAPINLRSLAESTIAPADSQEQTAPKYVSPFAKNEDYKELSQYKSTKKAEDTKKPLLSFLLPGQSKSSEYEDKWYEYVNRNPDVVDLTDADLAKMGASFSAANRSYLKQMSDEQIADYNYVYATQGKDEAEKFLDSLQKDLSAKQNEKFVERTQEYAREHPVAASAASVIAGPAKGLSLIGQLAEYADTGDIDPNSLSNRFVKQNQIIRQTVPENWSKVGQFLYGTGMSIADNLYNMALTGAFGNIGGLGEGAQSLILGIMGSSAAADSTLTALENGYSADRALIQGAIAGGIEALTEKISLETLLSPNAFKDGTIKYLLKNMAAEGSEEGASTISNWVVDWIGDLITDENRSDFRQVFTAFERGDTKEGWRKIGEMGLDLAQDVAGGMLSGGVLAGGGSVANTIGNINLGSALNQTSALSDMSEFVNDSYADSLKNPDATRYQKQLSQRALEQFYNDGKVSNRTLGELAQNNMYMAEEQANTVNLLNEASQRINQGKQITSSQMREILDNKQAVRTLRDNYGLRLNDNMSYSDRFNAVQDALTNRLNANDAQVKLGFRADMVAKFAKTLGKQGELTLNAMARANGYEDVEAFSKGYTQIYNAVKADPEVKLNDLSVKAEYSFTPQQLNTIYKSAVKDHEADLKKTGLSYEGETNAEETATGSQDSGTDGVGTVSLDTEVSTGSVAGRTAEVESRRKAADVRIESIRNNAALNSIAEVTSAEAGIPGGVNTDQAKTVRVLSESQWSALDTDTYNFLHELKDMGYEVKAWTGTALAYDEMSGKNAAVRGFIQGNTIGVRVDANLSARKIAYHEMFHDMVKTDSSLQADMVKKINEHYGEGKLETIVRDYVSQYGWTKASDEEILNEILADAYAGIDIYEDLEMNYEGATQVSSDVRGFLSENGVKTRNGSNAGQFSREGRGRGYVDKSMSVNAQNEYSEGNMPLSKWSKSAIADAVWGINPDIDVSKMTKQEMVDTFLEYKAWHHTGAFYNTTAFYGVSDSVADLTQSDIDRVVNDRVKNVKTEEQRNAERRNNELVAMSKDALAKYKVIFNKGNIGLKTYRGLLNRISLDNLDAEYQKVLDDIKAKDEAKVQAWEKLPEGHYRRAQAELFRNNIDAYARELYVGKLSTRTSEFKTIKERMSQASAGTDLERNGVELVDGTATKFSLDTWNETDKDRVLDALVKAGFGRSEASKWIDDVNSIAAIILGDRYRLDYDAADNQVMLKNNEEYVKTLDSSTLCAKRLLYQGTFNRITELLPDSILTPDDLIHIRKVMAEMGDTVPCGICYVESRRKTLSTFAGRWLNEVYKGKTKVTMNDLTSTVGLEKLRSEHPDIYNDYTSWMRKRGTANPKIVELRTSYRNDISKLTKGQIAKIIRIGGLRVQSFSDFETVHLIDMMQAILDMSAKGLTSQAYTKVPNFAWAFGDTGIKINLSLIGKAQNGKLVFDSKEGMDINDAMKLRERYSDNVGTILVGANDESILLAMADDRIDFIIPFHRSGWSQSQFEDLGLSGYDDYQAYQNERHLDGSAISEGNLYPIDYWDYSKTGKENAERYLEICKEQGRIPKFERFLVDNGDGSWSLQPDGSTDGYWKMLIDFKMYNNQGIGAPQRAVTPTFNMEECERILNEYDGEGNRSLPVDEEAAQKFVEEYKAQHQGQFSRDTDYMEAVNSGDMDTAQRMVDEAAKDAGYTIKAYHGTPNGTFNVFNDWSYFTENKDYADIYQNQGASSNRYKQTASNPRTYSVYLDPKEVFDTRNPRDREIFQNEFYMQWGNGTPLSERGLPDWTDGDDLIEFFEENDYDYNAFYLDEGGTGGYGEETKDRGISIIVKDSAQIKSADPVTYDDQGNVIPLSQRFNSQNNDIRYSRDLKSEEKRASGAKLTENQFYSLYSAHKLDMRGQGNVEDQIQAIRENGFKGTGGFSGNTMPTNLSYRTEDGKRVPANASVARYAPREGDRILLIPRKGLDSQYNVKLGYKPEFDYEIVTADYDYQPYYEMYSKAYDATNGNTVRFSRDTTGMESELQKQNKELNQELKEVTERYHYFKDQLVLTKVRQATEKSVNRVAKQLVKDYSSNVSVDEIAKGLREASFLYFMRVKDNGDINYIQDELKYRLRPYAMQMVTNASELINAEDVETQKSIRNDLRNGAGIIVTEQMKKDVPDWASFRKAQFGNMKLVSGPKTNIHDVYLELSQKYGEGYFPADVAHESDMLQVIADVMADLSAIYDNPYTYGGANIAEAIESCINDMMMSVVGSLEAEQPTFADKEKAKRDALRKQAIEAKNAALQRVREQRDDALAKQSARYKDRIKSIYNKRQQYELRTKIRRKVKTMSDKLLRPTDEKHIPYELQGAVIEVLRQINTGSRFDLAADGSRVELGTGIATKKTNAFIELEKRLTELSNELILDENLLDSKENGTIGYLTELAGLPEISIDSMNTEQLQSVLAVVNACEAAIRTWNKTVSDAKWAEISEAGEALYTENADKNPRDEYREGIERTINLLTVDNLTPEAYFSRMGNAGKALFKMLRAAQDDNIRILKEAQEFSEENGLYDLKLKDYEQKTVTVRFGNRDVEMSKAQLMELYILNKREASRVHIEVGGILPEAVQKKFGIKKVTYAEPIRNITQEDIAKAMTQLSPEDIKIADAMQEFISTVMTKHGNDASMKVYGYKKFGDENYWPIRVNSQDLRTELGEVKTRARSVSNKGFTKPIKPNANQSVAIGSIFDTFTEHVAEMANYASHLAVEKDINRIYNFTERDAKGAIEVSTKYVMRNVYGPQGTKYFEKLMQDLANGMVSEQSYFGGLVGKFKAAAVGSNLRVILQQPTAIFRAMDMISPRYLAEGLLHAKSGMRKAIKNSPIAQWKDWGYFDINTGRSTKNILFQNSSGLDRVQNALMSGAGLADSVSWGALYSAVEAEIKDTRPDLDARSKEFDKVVADRFADIIDHSQVVDGVLQRSALMRSQNWIDKFATAFMAEPTKQYNMMLTAIYDLQHSGPENKAKATKVLARTTAALLFAGVLNAAVQSIVDAIRDDDPEEKYWEKFLMKFTGEEDTVVEFMKSNLGDFLNPAQYVPYAKDIVSLFQGFDVERTDLSLFKDLIDDGKKVLNSFDGKGKYSQTNNIINFMNTASKFLGLSIGNVKRDVAGIANTIAQETGSYVFEYRMSKFTYNLNQSTNKGRFVQILAKAYEAGDTEAFNIIMNDLIKEDKFATTTMTTEEWIKKRLKDKHQIILK